MKSVTWSFMKSTQTSNRNILGYKYIYNLQQNVLIFFSNQKVIYIYISGRVFANGPGDLGSILCRVIPKYLKMVLDTSLLNTQQYKVHIEGKVEQSRERSSALPYTLVL